MNPGGNPIPPPIPAPLLILKTMNKSFSFCRLFRVGASVIFLSPVIITGCKKAGPGTTDGGAFAVPVVVAEAKLEPISERIFVVGTLAPNEVVEIKSEIDARVEELGFDEGESVKRGQVLFKLDDAKLKAAVNLADANFRLAETVLERNRTLLESRSISQLELDRSVANHAATQASLELARQNLIDATIMAPFDGIMGARMISPGQVVNQGTVLTTIVDTSPLKAEFNIPERFVGQLTIGQTIEIRVTAYEAETFTGEVYFISPQVNTSSRTVLMKARVPNDDGRLIPGMFGNLDLILNVKESAIVIPESAVNYRGDLASVYVVTPDGTADLRSVRVGIRLAGRLEITEGVATGERVVIEGTQKIGPGSPVSISPKSNLEAPEAEAPASDESTEN
jgi:membrane fusion protein (multidrug efflux system)